MGHGNGKEGFQQRKDVMRSVFWEGHSGADGGGILARQHSAEATNCLCKKSSGHRGNGRGISKQPSKTAFERKKKNSPLKSKP